MKKTIVTLSVIMLMGMSAFAQSSNENVRYNLPKGTQGWFIDLAGTYSVFASAGSSYSKMSTYYGGFNTANPRHLIGVSGKVGRRVSGSSAFRIGYDWHPSYNADSYFNFKSLHFDYMVSPLDLGLGYNPDRFYTLWLYGGVGLLACDKFPEGQTNSGNYRYFIHWNSALEMGVHGGIMNNFRLNNSLDLHVDLTAVATKWSYDSNAPEGSLLHRAHFDFSGMVGLMWYIGGRRFDACESTVAESDCSKQDAQIRILEDEIAELRNRPVSEGGDPKPCDTVVKFVERDGQLISTPFSIFFNKGSYQLSSKRDLVNLKEIAETAKAQGYKIRLRGTCDSATGSKEVNMRLAENRCNKVKEELVNMGVNASNIIVDAAGGVSELTPAELDRRVFVELVK